MLIYAKTKYDDYEYNQTTPTKDEDYKTSSVVSIIPATAILALLLDKQSKKPVIPAPKKISAKEQKKINDIAEVEKNLYRQKANKEFTAAAERMKNEEEKRQAEKRRQSRRNRK